MIDLHAHLGSLTTPRNLWRIMHKTGINVGVKDYHEFDRIIRTVKPDDYVRYLKKFELTHKIQSYPSSVEECVFLAIEDAFVDFGLAGIEIRFNPMLRNANGGFNLDDTILHACMGLQKALQAFPVKAGIIISTDKSFTEHQHMTILEKAVKYKDLGIVGIDCSGNTTDIEDMRRLIPMYKACHGILKKTVHAGETFEMIDEISMAISEMGIDRIGHGIQAHRNEYIMLNLKENDVCMEICPVSNITTGVVSNAKKMRDIIDTLHSYDIPITLNTDGNVFLNTNIHNQFHFIDEGIHNEIKSNSHKYSFL